MKSASDRATQCGTNDRVYANRRDFAKPNARMSDLPGNFVDTVVTARHRFRDELAELPRETEPDRSTVFEERRFASRPGDPQQRITFLIMMTP